MNDLPAPLVPADIDLSGLDGFMLDVQRLFASELWALSSGDEFKAALSLWGRAWQQTPPGSLPDDDKVLASFSGAGRNWKKIRAMALRGFVKCADGRLYHRILCKDVLEAAKRKAVYQAHREADRDRLKNWRDSKRRKHETPTETSAKLVSNDVSDDVSQTFRNDDETGTKRLRQDKTGQDKPNDQQRSSTISRDAALRSEVDYERFEHELRKAAKLLNSPHPSLKVVGPILDLLDEGFDLERHVLPVLRAKAAAGKFGQSWKFYVEAIRDGRSKSANGASPSPAPRERVTNMGGGMTTVPDANLKPSLDKFFADGTWPFPSPKPGEPGCLVPADLLPAPGG